MLISSLKCVGVSKSFISLIFNKILLGMKKRENFHLSRRITTDRMFRESGCINKNNATCFIKHAIRCDSQTRMIFCF